MLERLIEKWTKFLNTWTDFGSNGEPPLSKKGAIVFFLLIVIATVLPLICLASYPEPF